MRPFLPAVSALLCLAFATSGPARETGPAAAEIEEWPVPWKDTRPRDPSVAPDGRVWYVDFNQGYLGAYDPNHDTIAEWKTPSPDSGPYAMATDARGRIWFFETFPKPNLLQGFDPADGQWLPATAVPSGGGTVRHMEYDPRRNSLWFGTDTGHLGRARLP